MKGMHGPKPRLALPPANRSVAAHHISSTGIADRGDIFQITPRRNPGLCWQK
jgi:hypothetical protein